jgi:hypothetical protein
VSGHQLGRRRFGGLRPFRSLLGSFLLGIPLTVTGILRNVPDGGPDGYRGAPLIAAGLVMILMPLLVLAVRIIIDVIKLIIAESRRYRAWKRTLSPEELAWVNAAEVAATWAAAGYLHHKMHARHKEVAARLAQTQVHGFGPDHWSTWGNWNRH